MTQRVVLYHAGCMDGFCAAWLLKHHLQNVTCFEARYGEGPPPGFTTIGKHVYLVDFCYELDDMRTLLSQCDRLFVFDHHESRESVMRTIADSATVIYDPRKSGARITQDYLMSTLPWITPVWFVDYIEDRDLWNWAIADSRQVNAALASYPKDHATWDRFVKMSIDRLRTEGEALLRNNERIIQQHVLRASMHNVCGHRVPAVCATVLHSEIGERLANGEPFAATYMYIGEGRWKWSLRSNAAGLPVHTLAAMHPGGGGHPRAAGFITKESPDDARA